MNDDHLQMILQRHPAAIESVLQRSLGGILNPYDWLDRAVARGAKKVLVVICGPGPMVERVAKDGRFVVGVDWSKSAIEEGLRRGRREFVQADANHLPFAEGKFDAVVSDLGLAVNENRSQMLHEIARVLRPGGMFAGLAPALRPLNFSDIKKIVRLAEILRVRPHIAGQAEFRISALLAEAGLQKAEDSRSKFYFEVRNRSDAELLVGGLRATDDLERAKHAIDFLADRARQHEVKIPLPMRRILAIK